MELYQAYLNAQKMLTDLLSNTGGIFFYFGILIFLRLYSLIVKAWGNPYAYTSYIGNGGRCLARTRNSDAGTRPEPRLLILKS